MQVRICSEFEFIKKQNSFCTFQALESTVVKSRNRRSITLKFMKHDTIRLVVVILFAGVGFALKAQDDRFLAEIEGERFDRESYVLIWDNEIHMPKLVAYEVTLEELDGVACGGARYHADPQLDEFSTNFYDGAPNIGFEKGHLVPVMHGSWDSVSCEHTSLYSNILPQHERLNGGAWKAADELIDSLVRKHGSVYVHAGPLPYSVQSLPSSMPIPVGYWKLIIYQDDGVWKKESFLFSNYPYIDRDFLYVFMDGETATIHGRLAYLKEEDALEVGRSEGCEDFDIHIENGVSWYLPCKNFEFSSQEKLKSLVCDTRLLEGILGFGLYDSDSHVLESSETLANYISAQSPRLYSRYESCSSDAECLWYEMKNLGSQLGEQQLINHIRLLSFAASDVSTELTAASSLGIIDLVRRKLEPIKIPPSNIEAISKSMNQVTTSCVNLSFDDYEYRTVRIGDQCWLAENLRSTHFTGGEEIRLVTSLYEWLEASEKGEPVMCYSYFANSDDGGGALYNYHCLEQLNSLAPPGWHIPDMIDYFELVQGLNPGLNADIFEEWEIGHALKSPFWRSDVECSNFERTGFNAFSLSLLRPRPSLETCLPTTQYNWQSENSCNYWVDLKSFESVAEYFNIADGLTRILAKHDEEEFFEEVFNSMKEKWISAGTVFRLNSACIAGFDDDPKYNGMPVRLIQD